MLLSKGADDEVFVLKSFEIQIIISKLIDFINSNSDLFEVKECETDVLLSLNRSDHINPNVLNSMPDFRINEPLLVTNIDESEFLIDGNHRLQKRKLLSKSKTKYISVNGEQLDQFVQEFSLR